MRINGIDFQSQVGTANTKENKNAQINGMSFLDMMKLRSMQAAPQAAKASEVVSQESSIPSLFGAEGIEAIAAKSRVQYVSSGDVSDFLELVEPKPFIMEGMDLSEIKDTSRGDHTLSQNEIDLLRGKYDSNSLSTQEQFSLLIELVEMGALSKSDIQKTQMSVSPDSGDLMGYLAKSPEFSDVSAMEGTDLKGRLEAMISNERFTYEHVQSRYGQRCTSVKELADSHQKVLDTLNKL